MIFSLFLLHWASLTPLNQVTGWRHRMNSKAHGLYHFLLPADPRPLLGSWVGPVQDCCQWPWAGPQTNQSCCAAEDYTASERYMQKEISSSAFLKICGSIYAAPFQWLWLCQYVIMCMIMFHNSNTGDVYIETLLTPCDMYLVLLICILKYFNFFHLQTRYWLFLFFIRLLIYKL